MAQHDERDGDLQVDALTVSTIGNDDPVDGLVIEQHGDRLHIVRYWQKIVGCLMLAWAGVWFFLVHFMLSLGQQNITNAAILLAAPGIGLAYAGVTRLFNRTVIELDPTKLVVRHIPLPWFGNKNFLTRDIRGLQIGSRKIYTRGNTVHVCFIRIIRANGKKAALVNGIEMTEFQADTIAAALSRQLAVPVSL